MPFSNDEQIIETENPILTNIVLIIGFGLFFISLLSNAFCTSNGCRPSYEAFLVGWLVTLEGGAGIAWLANPFLILSWIFLLKNKKLDWLFALLSVIFGFSFLFFKKVLENEAGNYGIIKSLGIGYWFWVSSCIVTFIGIIIIRLKR